MVHMLWLAFNGSRAMVSTPGVLCKLHLFVGLHLNDFQPYKGILIHQASKQARRQISLLIPYGGAC